MIHKTPSTTSPQTYPDVSTDSPWLSTHKMVPNSAPYIFPTCPPSFFFLSQISLICNNQQQFNDTFSLTNNWKIKISMAKKFYMSIVQSKFIIRIQQTRMNQCTSSFSWHALMFLRIWQTQLNSSAYMVAVLVYMTLDSWLNPLLVQLALS